MPTIKNKVWAGALAVGSALVIAACGGGGGGSNATAGSDNSGPPAVAVLSLLAGNTGGAGNVDGMGAAFTIPGSVAIDSTGNVYVADTNNHTIRKITPEGMVSTLAGTAGSRGSADGTGAEARFNSPQGIAIDSSGNVYVGDTSNHTIRKITPAGVVSTLAGTVAVPGSTDGTGVAASFSRPQGVATDSAGNVYVADTNNSIIRKITPEGVVSTLAGTAGSTGRTDATGAAARFAYPSSVATDSNNNVYVADYGNNSIRKITPEGVVSTFLAVGAWGISDGTGAASFNLPNGITTDSSGNVYVADTSNQIIRKITPEGVLSTMAGTWRTTGSADGTGTAASFNSPRGLATDSAGNVYVADTNNSIIRKITPEGVVSTLAGAVLGSGSADGTGAAARFNNPWGLVGDSSGNVYVAEINNHTIRKITSAGEVTTLAGTAKSFGSADGTGATARFNIPFGLAAGSAGTMYVTDYGNHTIRKITPAGDVSTFAGTAGIRGSADGTGAAASFRYPAGIATDNKGNVYVVDNGNQTIRMITPEGVVSTLAGMAGSRGSTDGTGSEARFNGPSGVVTDSAGNVYVTDYGSNTLRKITPEGVVSTLAGTAGSSGSTDGAGSEARFNGPQGLATDSAGNIYVADTNNNAIRKITPAGVVTTVVGKAGSVGFVPGSLPGSLAAPASVAIYGTTLYTNSRNGIVKVTNLP